MQKLSFLIFSIFTFLFSNPMFAQQNDEGEQIENCLLWKISNLTTAPSYVFAYIPSCCEANMVNTDDMQVSFYDSEELIFDTDLSTKEAKTALEKGMQFSSKKKLNSLFANEQEFKNFDKKLKEKLGEHYLDAQNLKPVYLANLLSTKNLTCEKLYDFKEEYAKLATEMKKPISELESVKDYLSLMDKIEISTQKAMLENALTNDNVSNENKLFAKKDIRALYTLRNSQLGIKDMSNDYFYYRNKKWAAALKPKIIAKSCYIVVDAANVGGENGLLAMLLAEGFSIEPIINN